MADLFRKQSLQKLSSAEQLDRMIPMIRPSFWLVLAGAALVLLAGVLWGIFGRLPVCADGPGIVARDGQTVLCCLPLEDGKQVQAGMTVLVQRAAGDRQSTGAASTEVVWVEPYVTSSEDLAEKLGDEGLAEEFLAGGPVVAVECAPAGEALPAGTLLSCSVVLEEKPPLAFLFPALFGAA